MEKAKFNDEFLNEKNFVDDPPKITLSSPNLTNNHPKNIQSTKRHTHSTNNLNEKSYKNVNDLHRLKFLTVHKCKYWNKTNDRLLKGKLYIKKNGLVFKSSSFILELDYENIIDIIKIRNYLNTSKNVLSIETRENNENEDLKSIKSHVFFKFSISKDIIRNTILLFKENNSNENNEIKAKNSKLKRFSKSIKHISIILNQSSLGTDYSTKSQDSSTLINTKETAKIVLARLEHSEHFNCSKDLEEKNDKYITNQPKGLDENDCLKTSYIEKEIEPNANLINRKSMRLVKKMSSLNSKADIPTIVEETQSNLQKEDEIIYNRSASIVPLSSETNTAFDYQTDKENERYKFKKNPKRGSVIRKIFQSEPIVKLRSYSLNDNNFRSKINESKFLLKLISLNENVLNVNEKDFKESRTFSNSETQLNEFKPAKKEPELHNLTINRKRSTSLTFDGELIKTSSQLVEFTSQKHSSNRDSGFTNGDTQLDENDDVFIGEEIKNDNKNEPVCDGIQIIQIQSSNKSVTASIVPLNNQYKAKFEFFASILKLFFYFYNRMGDPYIVLAPFSLFSFTLIILSGLSNLSTLFFIDEKLTNLIPN